MTVDIIIPCYYSKEIIQPNFEKIASQSVIKDITVIMINDCSPYTNCKYRDIIEQYQDKIKIRYFETPVNSGPGIARQIGINNATSDFIMFLDDDDELYSNKSVEQLLFLVKDKDIDSTIFIKGFTKHVSNSGERVCRNNMCGCLFNRRLIQSLNIHFEDSLSFREEDSAFLTLLDMKTKYYRKEFTDNITYIKKWNYNLNSICNTSPRLNNILALINLKSISLSYFFESDNYSEEAVNDAILLIPPLLKQIYTEIINGGKISQKQCFILIQNILTFLLIMDKYKITLSMIHFNKIPDFVLELFNINSYLGEYNENVIRSFETDYKEWLNYIIKYGIE